VFLAGPKFELLNVRKRVPLWKFATVNWTLFPVWPLDPQSFSKFWVTRSMPFNVPPKQIAAPQIPQEKCCKNASNLKVKKKKSTSVHLASVKFAQFATVTDYTLENKHGTQKFGGLGRCFSFSKHVFSGFSRSFSGGFGDCG